MKWAGVIVAVFGVLLLWSAADVNTAPEGTYNIGLLQEQMMRLHGGGLAALIGTVIACAGRIVEELRGEP